MKNMHLEPINKDILNDLSEYTFTPERDFSNYDSISVSEDG